VHDLPDATVEVWAEDEHRVGLKSIVRRIWAPKGTRPMAAVKEKYEWLYVYAFVHPTSGDTCSGRFSSERSAGIKVVRFPRLPVVIVGLSSSASVVR
jgi:hypothetical protein